MIYKKGIALLLTIIIISIVLAISVSLSNIVSTEIFLSNTGRQSQVAIYAADAGVDCAIYWDTHPGDPNGYTTSPFGTSSPAARNITCAGETTAVGGWATCTSDLQGNGSFSPCSTDASADPTDHKAGRSEFILTFDNGSCAIVEVIKIEDYSDPTFPIIATKIHSDGHSSGNSTCESNNPRVFQRSLETTVYE